MLDSSCVCCTSFRISSDLFSAELLQCTICPIRLGLITCNRGFVTHTRKSLLELMLLSVTGLVDISPIECCSGEWRSIIKDDATPTPMQHSSYVCLTVTSMWLKHVLFWIAQHKLSTWDSHCQVNNKSVTDTSILHSHRNIVDLSRERMTLRIALRDL